MVNPEKKPWRQLTALLSFLESEHDSGFECLNLKQGIQRLGDGHVKQFGIWSGGLKVSSNAGEQYVSGGDDCIESETWLEANCSPAVMTGLSSSKNKWGSWKEWVPPSMGPHGGIFRT